MVKASTIITQTDAGLEREGLKVGKVSGDKVPNNFGCAQPLWKKYTRRKTSSAQFVYANNSITGFPSPSGVV